MSTSASLRLCRRLKPAERWTWAGKQPQASNANTSTLPLVHRKPALSAVPRGGAVCLITTSSSTATGAARPGDVSTILPTSSCSDSDTDNSSQPFRRTAASSQWLTHPRSRVVPAARPLRGFPARTGTRAKINVARQSKSEDPHQSGPLPAIPDAAVRALGGKRCSRNLLRGPSCLDVWLCNRGTGRTGRPVSELRFIKAFCARKRSSDREAPRIHGLSLSGLGTD